MAEVWTLAFGRYLRTLRDRQGLSLHAVVTLSQPFAERVTKGYLSRCENGRVRLALSKVTPLGHIYKVSADVLLERSDLDMELDRVGSPETEGMDFAALSEAGRSAFTSGYRWRAYGYLRDAIPRAGLDPVRSMYRDRDDQLAAGVIGCATAAFNLGRARFALHEYEFVKDSGMVSPHRMPLVLERLSATNRGLDRLDRARGYAEQAIAAAERPEGRAYLGYAYACRALQAHREDDLELAAALFQKSHRSFRQDGRDVECARALSNLAQAYFDLGRYRAARRALLAAEKIVEPMGQHRIRALVRILLGEIDLIEHHEQLAERRWREAAAIARKLDDKLLCFKAEYPLLRQALQNGNHPVARALQRRLSRLSNYVPSNTPELHDYEHLLSRNDPIL